jgi:hypothetical protein
MSRSGYALILMLVACGRGESSFHLDVAASDLDEGAGIPTVSLETDQTRSVFFVAVGSATDRIVFSSPSLPRFATLDGPLLTLSPTRQDQGQVDIDVIARTDSASARATLRVRVTRPNRAPHWSFGSPYLLLDDHGLHHGIICPGPYCTLIGTAKVTLNACDEDGDGINLEVEVVERGKPFSGKPTYSTSLPPSAAHAPDVGNRNCGQLTVPLSGLPVDRWYQFELRVMDEFGAAALMGSASDSQGWTSFGHWYFDQGPCTAGACACLPPGWPSERDDQCCSGASDPYAGPLPGFFSGTCR